MPLPELADQRLRLDPGQRVERAERLVEQHQIGIAYQGARERSALRLTAGEDFRPDLGPMRQPDFRQGGLGPRAIVATRQAQHDIAPDRLPGHEPGRLKGDRHLHGYPHLARYVVIEIGQHP